MGIAPHYSGEKIRLVLTHRGKTPSPRSALNNIFPTLWTKGIPDEGARFVERFVTERTNEPQLPALFIVVKDDPVDSVHLHDHQRGEENWDGMRNATRQSRKTNHSNEQHPEQGYDETVMGFCNLVPLRCQLALKHRFHAKIVGDWVGRCKLLRVWGRSAVEQTNS
jgi:hypothetical protein